MVCLGLGARSKLGYGKQNLPMIDLCGAVAREAATSLSAAGSNGLTRGRTLGGSALHQQARILMIASRSGFNAAMQA